MRRLFIILFTLMISRQVYAGSVEIIQADFKKQGSQWRVAVTLKHADTGWDHYADAWRVVLPTGKIVATRTLAHPHVNEQPFTRSLTVNIPPNIKRVYIEARDNVHGWSKQRLEVDLTRPSGPRYTVTNSKK